jgi:hypothetical protein
LQYEPWFYDGVLVYQQIGNYQNNPAKWAQAVANVMQVYRDGYLLPNNGALQGYMIFTEGLYRDYIATGTAADLTAIDDVDLNSSYAQSAGGAFSSTVYQREAVYMLEADLWASKLNNPVKYSQPASYWLQYDVAHVLGMIDQQCGQTPTQPYEYFMAGLQAEALIKYYINTGSTDVRIPAAVKQLADCIWSSGWGATADDLLAFPYNSNFAEYGVTLVASGGYGGAELNLLVAPMYAWLYKMTGNTTYQTEGDAIWQSGVLMADGGGVPGTIGWTGNGGKQFSQNYRWSFDYVNWRSTP